MRPPALPTAARARPCHGRGALVLVGDRSPGGGRGAGEANFMISEFREHVEDFFSIFQTHQKLVSDQYDNVVRLSTGLVSFDLTTVVCMKAQLRHPSRRTLCHPANTYSFFFRHEKLVRKSAKS